MVTFRLSGLRWHLRLQRTLAFGTLLGVGVLCAVFLTKTVFLGSDSAQHYSDVWYISDQIFHHARLPLHIQYLDSGRALSYPYAVVPYTVTAVPFALFGDRAVTVAMVLGFVLYGYAATRARPVLRDPRLLALIYINTYLIEGFLSFQFAFIWACVFFFLCVEAIDKRLWLPAAIWAILAVTTHPFAGAAAVGGYSVYAVVRRPRDIVPLGSAMAVAALIVLPYALYIRTDPSIGDTKTSYIIGTLKYMVRFRGIALVLPLIVAPLAPVLRPLFLPAFLTLAAIFGVRLLHKDVNTYGLNHNSAPFYGEFLKSPQFDRSLTYRVLEPNDREDGAYQLIKQGAVLGQEFFDQSQFRRWWYSLDMYSCFLGAKNIDVVFFETEYKWKFNQNEQWPLGEFAKQGKVRVLYTDPLGRFVAYDVRGAKMAGARLSDCGF
ncbi:MAG: hypothetical protein ABR978_05490 [Dehalococcoidia bacterium]|jgi:hypothetical protein